MSITQFERLENACARSTGNNRSPRPRTFAGDLDFDRRPSSTVKNFTRENGFNLGGEQSGHIVLSDFSTTGDGLIAALQVLAVLRAGDKPMSELCNVFEPLPQFLRNVRYRNCEPLENALVKEAIAEGERRLASQGRLVIRKSGTEPLIRVMGEGDDEKLVKAVVNDIVSAIEDAAAA